MSLKLSKQDSSNAAERIQNRGVEKSLPTPQQKIDVWMH
jgi:hypothetical protein